MQTQQQSFQATAPLVAGDPTAVSFCPTLLDTSFSLHKAPEVTSHALLTGVTSANRAAVVVKLLELIERDNPKLVWVTDDGSLAGIAAASGMPYLNLDPAGAGFCLNPFWLPLDRREGVRYRPSPDETLSMAMVVALMLDEVGYQPEPEHVSALVPLLFKAVSRSYSVNHAGTPGKEVTFTDFVTNLNSIQVSGLEGEAIGKLLAPFHGEGQYAGLFDGEFCLPGTDEVAIFGTQLLTGTPAFAPALSALQLHSCKRIMYELPRLETKAMVINHDWSVHRSRYFGQTLEALYREYRRYNASYILLTDHLKSLRSAIDSWDLKFTEDSIMENLCHHLDVLARNGQTVLSYSAMDDSPAAKEAGLVSAGSL